MGEIAVIGDSESVLPYKAFGFATFQSSAEESGEVIRRLMASGEYRIIFIIEEYAELQRRVLDELGASWRTYPVVIEIPSVHGATGLGKQKIKRIMEKAVGVDVLSKEEVVP